MFDRQYQAVLADTPAARRLHHRVRFQVYCMETGFEEAQNFPDHEERDAWDRKSAHFLIRARATGDWVAAARIVLPGDGLVPAEAFARIDPEVRRRVPREHIGEISRLCTLGRYRKATPAKREGADAIRFVPERRREPELVLGLLRAAAAYSREHDIRYWYFLITPALARILTRLNIQLDKVGPLCRHRGERYPFLADLARSERQMAAGSPEIAAMLRRGPAYMRYSELHPTPLRIPAAALPLGIEMPVPTIKGSIFTPRRYAKA
jgi:N-acyl amino acid synthase of PEP-CTERM/exosortase system